MNADLSKLGKDMQASMARLNQMMKGFDYASFKMPDIKPIGQIAAESFQEAIRVQLEALQSNLGPEEELLLYYFNGIEFIRIQNIYLPSDNLVVLAGTDQDQHTAMVLGHIQSIQFTCKVVTVEPEKQPQRIGFHTPEAS